MLLVDYQKQWVEDFNKIKNALLDELKVSDLEIEHVGSTSVPGMYAKPIIDIDIVYHRAHDFESVKENLESLGYFHNGNQGIDGREVFKRKTGANQPILDGIAHHLYGCHKDSDELRKHLLFRNHLWENEDAKNKYSKLKLDLALKANQDKKIYALLKEEEASDFIGECIKKQE